MARVETYARYKVHEGKLGAFREKVTALVEASKAGSPVRLDWFSNDETSEAAGIAIHRDDDAIAVHLERLAPAYQDLLTVADLMTIDQLGGRVTGPVARAFGQEPRHFDFDGGVHEVPDFDPEDGVIEIFTRFFINPGELETFQAYADEILAIVREKDPGTIRYDWFYDKAGEQCIAMDTYAGWDGTVTHMKNCHEPHDALLKHSKMITEFLGRLKPDLEARLASFKPYVFQFDAGLKPYSTGLNAGLWPAA